MTYRCFIYGVCAGRGANLVLEAQLRCIALKRVNCQLTLSEYRFWGRGEESDCSICTRDSVSDLNVVEESIGDEFIASSFVELEST